MSRRERLVVIGGVAAGLSAASYAKRRRPDMEVTVFERSPHASYGSCGLPYLIEGLVEDPGELIALPLEDLRQKRGLDVRVLHEVTHIDTKEKSVIVSDIVAGKELRAPYDSLVISTGASPVAPPLPGIDMEGVFVLRTLEDGVRLEDYMKSRRPKKTAVIGGGYIGLEMAEAFSIRGCEVTVIERLNAVLPGFDKEIAASVERKLLEKGVRLMLSTGVLAFERTGTAIRVIAENEDVEADLVLLAAGIRPNTALAEKAGVGLGTTGAKNDNRRKETNVPGRKQIKIKLISEKGTKRLLGAQAVGGEGVAKRIDVFAAAIWAGMTLDDVAWLDLTYVPPVSTVWDPVLLAAQVASKAAGATQGG